MSNSNLVDYIKLSPNCTKPRLNKIEKITIHMVAGNCTVETLGDIFAPKSRQASSNYGIGSDGRVGMYVEEVNRSWCSGNRDNDHRAITIEVANDSGAPDWHVSDKAMKKLIELCVDICKRNGIKKLNFTGDKSGNLTMHKWFQDTSCPGPYLESKFPYIAKQVNIALGAEKAEKDKEDAETKQKFNINEIVNFKGGTQYSTAFATSGTTKKAGKAKVTKYYNENGATHNYHLIGENGGSNVYGWVDEKNIEKIESKTTSTPSKSKFKAIEVDGSWGEATTTLAQQILGTTVTGKISQQSSSNKKYLQNASSSSWAFVPWYKAKSSNLIKAIQKLVGEKVDGKCGKNTVKALQNFLNKAGYSCGKADGYMGEKTVKAWQKYLNDNR